MLKKTEKIVLKNNPIALILNSPFRQPFQTALSDSPLVPSGVDMQLTAVLTPQSVTFSESVTFSQSVTLSLKKCYTLGHALYFMKRIRCE